ncbi:MAG: VWA domain-containing protein [Dehalococcoidales bacterium]|nr:MAG: VWA domain-containing protein [Dehalococcoidales bacterium]
MAKDRHSATKFDEKLKENDAVSLITTIVQRTRNHPEIVRGSSVRGALAFKQVLEGYSLIRDQGLTRYGLEKAAMITLPPRISTKQGTESSAEEIIRSIVREVLYTTGNSKERRFKESKKETKKLTLDEFMAALQNLSLSQTLETEEFEEYDDEYDGNFEIVDGSMDSSGFSMEKMAKDSDYTGRKNWFPSLDKALKDMMGQLEQKLINGEISEGDYRYQKKKLEDMLDAASYLQAGVSGAEIAETVMELMEAGDKQWQKELDFQDMYVYYHIKQSQGDSDLNLSKRNWYALKVIVDFLEKQDMVESSKEGTHFSITYKAMDIMLKNLLSGTPKNGNEKDTRRKFSKHATERSQDTRRYVTGDVFRDISIRRTMREIARRRRKTSEINRHDLRIFLKEHREPKSDILLCVDSSGSMGFHRKLIMARLSAAAIARDALRNGNRVGVVTFDDLGKAEVPPTDNEDTVMRYITGITSGGNTNIGDGLKCAETVLKRERSRNRKIIMLITDGEPTAITQKAVEKLGKSDKKDMTGEYAVIEARNASAAGIETSVIHITDEKASGKNLVESIAKAGHGEVKRIARPDDLKTIML